MLHHLAFLLIAALVLLAPGMCVAGALGLNRLLPASLMLPTALVLGQVVATVGVLLQLAIGLPIDFLAAWLLLVAVNAGARWWWTARRRTGPRAAASFFDETPPCAKQRRLHRAGMALPLTWLAVVGFIVGAQLKSDTLWHAAYSLKLMEQAEPSFTSLGIQSPGIVPSYLVPAWHGTVGVAAWASGTAPHVAYWLLPTLLLPVAALAAAGLARVATGRSLAEPLAALAYLAITAADGAPRFAAVDTASYPSHVVTEVAFPVAMAGWLLVLWPRDGSRRAGWALLVAGLVATIVLHGNYIVWLGMLVGGYLAAWATVRRWQRSVVRRHAVASAALLALTVTLLGCMFIGWKASPQLGRGANDAATESVAETFSGTFAGDAASGSYRLEPAVLVPAGGAALVALLALPLVAWHLRRMPGSWLAAGAMLVAIVLSQLPFLVPKVVEGGSTSVAARLGDGLPHALVLTLSLLAFASVLGSRRGSVAAGLAAAAAFLMTAAMHQLVPDPASWVDSDPARLVPGSVAAAQGAIVLCAGAMLGALALGAIVTRIRSGRARAATGAAPADEPKPGRAAAIAPRGALLAWVSLGVACLISGAAGAGSVRAEWNRWAETSGGWSNRAEDPEKGRLPNVSPTGRNPQLLADMGTIAARIPEGDLVAAPSRVVYFVAATEPVRVVVEDEHVRAFDRDISDRPQQRVRAITSSGACWALLPPDRIGASIARVFHESPRTRRLVARGPREGTNLRWQLWTIC